MKVGIDAKWYFSGPASGKMVIRNLVNELLKIENDIQFYIILDKNQQDSKLDFSDFKANKLYIWAGNNLLSNIFCIPKLARKHNLDYVLYQTAVSCFGRHKKIAYIHDLIYITHPQYFTLTERIYLKPLKFLTKFADSIVTVSESEKLRIQSLGFSDKNIQFIHHGYDPIFKTLDLFDPEDVTETIKKFKLPQRYILNVGRINTRKNIPNLLKAFKLLEDETIKLVLVGKNDWKTDNLKVLINDPLIKNRIIFTGGVSNHELAIIYAKALIFCFPSYEEAFGLPPLEAMASGVPVVVSNSSSMPEVCGDAGLYVDADSPISISQGLTYLIKNDLVREKYRSLSLERAKSFSWNKAANELITIFSSNVDVE